MSAHASTATITLGGCTQSPQPQQQQYTTAPAQPTQQAGQGQRRRRRQNVPEHMQESCGQPVAPSRRQNVPEHMQESCGQPVAPSRRQNVPEHMQESCGQPVAPSRQPNVPAHMQGPCGQPVAPSRPVTKPSYGGAMPFGTVYTKQGQLQSSTPDQAYQTQSLFRDNAPPPVQQAGIRNTHQSVELSHAPCIPTPNEMTSLEVQRAAEARAKLRDMNISDELVEKYRRRFNVLDLNKDGVVNLREFAAISRVLGYKFSKEEVLDIFGRKDIDDSGGISFDEFVIAMYERSQKSKELAPYREKFRMYDWKEKGYVTSDEAYPILKKELGFDENKTEMLIDLYDRNRDYQLSLLEFIEFYKRVEELKVQVHNAFRDFDRNGDGFVDATEAKAVLKPKGFTDQQVEALIFKYDKDADGRLNFAEFAAFWDVQLV